MNLHIFIRTALFALLCGLLAACQTAGLKPGSFETRFPVPGWVEVQSRGTTAYYCRSCSTPQLIVSGPSKLSGDVESAIRNDILSTGLLSELVKSASKATGGAIRLQSRRKISTKSYSGFELVYRIQAPGKKPFYVATRSIVQKDRGMQINSYARSSATAKANLRKFMANTTIRRLP